MQTITSLPRIRPQWVLTRNRWASLVPHTLLGLLALLLIFVSTGAAYQGVRTTLDAHTYSPPGQQVDVGGYQLHLYCIGEGSPTVILEAALAATSAHWAWVQPEVAKTTRVCAYDRAGMGWSGAGPAPRDAQQLARELHTLLERGGVQGPYVLVAHSIGAWATRHYFAQYPNQVAGMVLIDATHPDLWSRLPPELGLPEAWMLRLFPPLAWIGATCLFFQPFPTDPDLPAQQRAAITALTATTRSMSAIAAELQAIPVSAEQVRAAGKLGDLPLIVLTAGNAYAQLNPELAVPAKQAWAELQVALTALSSNSRQRIIPGATHESLVYKQGDALVTSAAIVEIVMAARNDQPLD